MTIRRKLAGDERGMGAVEFALVAPVLLGFIIGLTQLGMLFFANSYLHNAVGAGARLAMIWPRPTDDQIKQRIVSMLPKLDQAKLTTPVITHGTDADGRDYADISINYQVPLNFIFYKPPPVTLKENRRVFIQDDTPISPTTNPAGASTSTTSASTSTTSSGTTSASTSTTSASTSASTTSATSSGTTTSSSSWGTTTTSTTSSTTSGNNASSGNASSGNGHAHGNCNGNNC